MPGKNVVHAVIAFVAGVFVDLVRGEIKHDFAADGGAEEYVAKQRIR